MTSSDHLGGYKKSGFKFMIALALAFVQVVATPKKIEK